MAGSNPQVMMMGIGIRISGETILPYSIFTAFVNYSTAYVLAASNPSFYDFMRIMLPPAHHEHVVSAL